MSLLASKTGLRLGLENCFELIEKNGLNSNASPDEIRKMKAKLMADTIHTYTMSALVQSQGTGIVFGLCYTAVGVGSVFGSATVFNTGTVT